MKNYKWQLILLNWLLIWLPTQAQSGGCCDQGYPEAGPISDIDVDGDGNTDFYYSLFASSDILVGFVRPWDKD